jgi:hypothetical protein
METMDSSIRRGDGHVQNIDWQLPHRPSVAYTNVFLGGVSLKLKRSLKQYKRQEGHECRVY